MKHIVPLSGGKDSLATTLYMMEQGIEFDSFFCDTKWEIDVTYGHINEVVEKLGLNLITRTSKKYDGLLGLSKDKKRFPSTKAKFCTVELKVNVMIDYILDEVKDNVTMYQGIRWQESRNRSGLDKQDDYFKHYFEPYGFTKGKYHEQLKKAKEKAKRMGVLEGATQSFMFGENRIVLATIEGKDLYSIAEVERINEATKKPKYHNYRKKDVISFLDKYDAILKRPIISWYHEKVFEFIKENGLHWNPLYDLGFTRVGCLPCIMCTKNEVLLIMENFPERIDLIREKEKEFGSTFFPPNYIPTSFCTKKVVSKKGIESYVPTIDDVISYVQSKNSTPPLFAPSCKNPYVPCE